MREMSRSLHLLSVPYHAGQRDVGMGLGPTELLERRHVADHLARLGHDVAVKVVHAPDVPQEIKRTFGLDARLAEAVSGVIAADGFPLVLSGNCNSALGTTAGIGRSDLGVVWFDAHADFDTPEDNLSGFFDVMALSTLTGSCWAALRETIPGFRVIQEINVVLVGIRDLEPYQQARLAASAVRVAYAGESKQGAVEETAIAHLEALAPTVDGLYVHVDLDSLDDSYGMANEYAAPFGLRIEQVARIVAAARAHRPIRALAFTAYNPTLDDHGRFATAAVATIEAVVASACPCPNRQR
jgi:arginase